MNLASIKAQAAKTDCSTSNSFFYPAQPEFRLGMIGIPRVFSTEFRGREFRLAMPFSYFAGRMETTSGEWDTTDSMGSKCRRISEVAMLDIVDLWGDKSSIVRI